MDVAARVAAHLDQLMHERQDRIADDIGLFAHVIEIDALNGRLARDHVGGFGGNHAGSRFSLGQRDFDVDIALDQRMIGKQRAHLRGSEGVAKQDGIDHGAGHRNGRVCHCNLEDRNKSGHMQNNMSGHVRASYDLP